MCQQVEWSFGNGLLIQLPAGWQLSFKSGNQNVMVHEIVKLEGLLPARACYMYTRLQVASSCQEIQT